MITGRNGPVSSYWDALSSNNALPRKGVVAGEAFLSFISPLPFSFEVK